MFIYLLDCCYAGGSGVGKVKGIELTKSPMPDEVRALFAEGSCYALIASSEEDEASLPGKPYSVFTGALIET